MSDDRVPPQKVEVVHVEACVRPSRPRTLRRDSLEFRRSERRLRQAPRARLHANTSLECKARLCMRVRSSVCVCVCVSSQGGNAPYSRGV